MRRFRSDLSVSLQGTGPQRVRRKPHVPGKKIQVPHRLATERPLESEASLVVITKSRRRAFGWRILKKYFKVIGEAAMLIPPVVGRADRQSAGSDHDAVRRCFPDARAVGTAGRNNPI